MDSMENGLVRETELSREMNRLERIITDLEDIRNNYSSRLEGVLGNGGLKPVDSDKTPENSSKLGQELNSKNLRLNGVAKSLSDLLNRLEI